MKNKQIFERKEVKYLLTQAQFFTLIHRLKTYMVFDDYGQHVISSVYYDTPDFDVIRHCVSQPKFKEKLRLRCYGTPTSEQPVFLELKKKVAGTTYKRRETLPYAQALAFLSGQCVTKKTQILNEIAHYLKQGNYAPKALIRYDRLAMFHRNYPDFRITFDENVRYRLTDFDLTKNDANTQKMLTDGFDVLMEIKISECFPLEISRILSEQKIFQGKFTKYGNLYKQVIAPNYYRQTQVTPFKNTLTPKEETTYALKYSI